MEEINKYVEPIYRVDLFVSIQIGKIIGNYIFSAIYTNVKPIKCKVRYISSM